MEEVIKMYSIINEEKYAILLLHEIYGINMHIKGVAKELANYNYDIYCPNLLNHEGYYDYNEEDKAYNYFINEITIKSAFAKVERIIGIIRKRYKKIVVIGYSIGATIAWLCSNKKYCDGVIGFYGSRIRDYCCINPICPTLLIFAEQEKSFNVKDVIKILMKREKVNIQLFEGNHGFADRYSNHYYEPSSNKSFKLIDQFLYEIGC